jgi:hypothetical protein
MSRGISHVGMVVDTSVDGNPDYSAPLAEPIATDNSISFPSRTNQKQKRSFRAPEGVNVKEQQADNIYAENVKQAQLARRIRELASKSSKKN